MRTGSGACRAIAAQAHASESLPPHPLPAKARKAKPLKRTAARRPLSSSPSRFLHNQLSKRAEGKNPSGPEGASSKPKATKRTSYFICPSSSSDSHETFSNCGFNFLEPCAHVEKFSFLPSLCALSTVQTQVNLSNCLGWVPLQPPLSGTRASLERSTIKPRHRPVSASVLCIASQSSDIGTQCGGYLGGFGPVAQRPTV